MATTQTFTSNTTYAIPSDAANVTYIIHGGKGGQGGPASTRVNRSGAAGARGQKISGTLTGVAGSTLTLTMGGPGSRCFGDSGANGGSGYWNGGRGGNNNSYDSSSSSGGWNAGGGGGGGGATAIRIGSTVLAGAGGGGGGACICSSTNGAQDAGQQSSTINTSGGSSGANGQNSGAAWNGAGGGAGGGFPGGTTSGYGPGYAWQSGNDGSGFGGAGGAGFYNTSYHNNASTIQISDSDSSFITISYDAQIVTEDSSWTTRSPQLDNIVGAQGSDPANLWTTFLTNTNVGGNEPEGSTVIRSIEWKINFNNTGKQVFNTAVDDSGDVYIDNVFQFSLNTYNANTSLTTVNDITAGEHILRIEHVNSGGPYGVAMDWTGYVPPAPPTVSLTATDYSTPPNNITSIYKGQSLRLTYSASIPTNGDAITGNTFTATANGLVTYPITTVGNSGIYFPAPTVTTTYTYTATNANGTSTTSVTITVNDDYPVVTLTSDDADNTIISGGVPESVTLTWSATANTTISSTTMTGVASPGTSGSVTVSPTTTTTYTFRATTATGTRTASVIITVNTRPIITLTSNTSTISRGQSVNLIWNTTGSADSIVWSSGVPTPASGSSLISGSVAVAPTDSQNYCIYATGPGGISDTKCVTINVIQIDTSITDYDQSFTNDFTVNIPTYAINVNVDISAAGGRNGGTDAGGASGSGGAGRRATLYFPDYVARTFTVRLGNQGSAGFGCVAGSGVGVGGSSNVARGGNGGASGPSGCSGGGGGGGGASGIYDSVKNGWVAIVGGGGGGGGASWNASATNGSTGTGMNTGNVNSISNGNNGSSCPTDGGGGGGGGGGATGGSGGNFGLDNNRGGVGGNGGQSAYDNSYCSFNYNSGSQNFGDGSARVRWNIGAPTIDTFTVSPSPIIAGESTRLTWTSTNSLSGSINNGVNAVTVPDSFVDVFPSDDTTYTLTVVGYGGLTDTDTVSVVVYIPPVLILVLNSPSIIVNGSTNLSWSVTGDGDSLYWVAGGIINANLNSNVSLSPSVTTTYSGYVTGLGGTSPIASIKLIVYYPPTLIVDYPAVIDYGQQAIIEYEGDYANTSVTLSATYNYDYVANTTDPIVNLNVASSAEFGSNSPYSGTYNTNIVYTDRGPLSISYVITATGNGGSTSEAFTVLINVDKTPDNIDIDETGDLFKDADPVYTPETDVLSEMYYIDDIEIQVEVKSNNPILVDLNANQQWTKLRQIGTAPAVQGNSVGGNSMPTKPGVYYIKPRSLQTEAPLIAKSNLSAVEAAKLITCLSVIDETQGSYYNNQGNLNNVWQQNPPIIGGAVDNRRGFRTAFPYRTFYLLDPQGSGQSGIDVPTNFPGDPNAFGPIRVNRDEGNTGSRSDWFAICNFGSLPYGTIVSIWIDISGSMRLSTVRASYDYFLARCAAAGIEIVLSLSAAGERYIEGHIVYLPPSANFTAEDANGNTSNIEVIAGSPVTLSWIVFGDVNTLSISPGVLNITPSFNNFVDSAVVNPTSDTTYILNANGPAGTTTRQITISVLIPPTISLISSQGLSIINGNCTTLSWSISGDGNSISWTQGGISNTNANSSAVVCPNDTTTYCVVASGPGGVSPETCIEITVYQNPTASITAPGVIDYSVNFTIEYETQYANTSIQITPTYTYLNGTVVTGTTINRTSANSAEINGGSGGTVSDTRANGTGVPITVPWNNFGPYQIDFVIVASGTGGTAQDTARTIVNIDQTPDNFVVDETDEKLKDQDPVYTPETEILSEMYLINDIDIPVEIKADYPIKVDINKNDDWDDVRQI